MSFRRGELAVKLGLCCIKSPSQEFSKIRMAARRPTGSGPKDGATSPQARATSFGDILSQLENDMAEIRDGTMKDVQLLKDEIEEINRRFGAIDPTGNSLDDLRVRANCHENDITDLRRQVERTRPLCPHQTSRWEHSRSPCTLGNAVAYLGFLNNFTHGLYRPGRKMRLATVVLLS